MSTIESAPSAEKEFKSARPVEEVPTTGEIDVIVNGPESKPQQPARSRMAELLQKGSDKAHEWGDRLQDAAENRQNRFDQNAAFDTYSENINATKSRERNEKIDEVKDAFRGIGRGGLRFFRRAQLEVRAQAGVAVENAAAFGQNVADKAVDLGYTVADKAIAGRDAIVNGANIVKDTAVNTANVVRDTVVDKAAEVKSNVTEKYESLKAGAEQTLREIDSLVTRATETGSKMANQLAEGIEQKAAEWKAKAGAEYTAARDAVGNLMLDKVNQLNDYFAARKEAALSRKQARLDARAEKKQARADARDERAAARAKTAEINDRVVNVRKMEIREQQEARRADSAEAREARRKEAEQKREARRRGRAALGTAIRSGIYTAKETYNTLK